MDDDTGDSPTLASGLPGPRGLVAGRYQVRRRLGRGASKEVYLAYDERLDREVAVAIVVAAGGDDVGARARVAREAHVTGRLGDHPNVITVYDSGEHDGVPYLVLRAMAGGSLAEALTRERPSIDQAIRLGREIAGALAHAHDHGVVHRDVRPDNVWLGTDGVAALGDFGIACVAGADRLSAAGVVVGTVRYLSPEQIRGDDEIGPASDLYALGVTLYELVAGQPPFTAQDPTQVLTQHLTAAPLPPSQHEPAVPPALERLILELLAKEPADRPASAAAVFAELGDEIRQALAAEVRVDPASGRLLELRREQPALLRTPQTPFVGRRAQLDELHAALAQTRDERVCRLITVAGSPGIGKSRLAGEFLTALGDDVTVLAGRCPAYGEGTTYSALADLVRGLGGDSRRRIEELLAGDEEALRGILAAIGLSDEPAHPEETAWALRRLFERLARDRPLVVAIEDIQWAQAPLLDLLDHVVALSSGAPILLLCLARPELLEARPAWAAPQPNRSVVVLDALDDAQARELASLLGAGGPAARIAQRAEGNPLFVEQLVAVDAGQDEGELPASIQAVLSARIDRLEDHERTLLLRAAVEGRTFHTGALAAPAPGADQHGVSATLVELASKGLVGADRSEYPAEDAFRFTHALIREVAYAGIPELVRADLHAGVAEWLEQRPAAADEIVGYHLEQACRLAAELGRSGEHEAERALRAVKRLEAASRGALGRGDPAAGSVLIERAVALLAPGAAARGALLPALGASLFEAGRMTDATEVLDEAVAQCSDVRVQARAEVEREFVRLQTEIGFGIEHALEVADAATTVLERERDDFGQCRAWSLRARAAWTSGQVARADDAWRRAADCAGRAGDERAQFDVLAWRATAAVLGPLPVDDAIGLCEGLREHVAASPVAVAWMVDPLAALHAMRGEFEQAERLLGAGDETRRRLGRLDAGVSHHAAFVRLLAGEPALAELPLRAGIERLAPMSDGRLMATTTALLAQALHAQGRLGEAAEQCRLTAATAAFDDIVSQGIWRGVQAKILARDGRCAEAKALAREAVALLEPTDLLSHHGDALLDLADVLRACSRRGEGEGAIRKAVALYELKGNVVAAERARSQLARGQT